MPVNISGVTVATLSDLDSLERTISGIQDSVYNLEARFSEFNRTFGYRLSSVENKLDQHTSQINTLEATIRRVEQSLTKMISDLDDEIGAMTAEITRSDTLLLQTNQYLVQNNTSLDEITDSARQQVSQEAAQRQELARRFDSLLKTAETHTTTLRDSFTALQAEVTQLIKIDQENTRLIERSLRALRESVLQVQSQTQDDLAHTTGAVQGFAQAKEERWKEEAGQYQRLVGLQESLHQSLMRLRQTADTLAGSAGQAEGLQKDSLRRQQEERARQLNQAALGHIYGGEPGQAAPLLEEAARLAPQQSAIMLNLAHVRFLCGQVEEARTLLEPLLADPAAAGQAHFILGLASLQAGDAAAALPHLEQAVRSRPGVPEAEAPVWLALGQARRAVGQIQPALEAWRQAVRLDPAVLAAHPQVRMMLEEDAV